MAPPSLLLGDEFVLPAGNQVLAAAVIHPPAPLSWEPSCREGREKSAGVNGPVTASQDREGKNKPAWIWIWIWEKAPAGAAAGEV